MSILYHYCNAVTAYNILKSSSLQMSDISKSNDYKELNLFFPGLFRSLMRVYIEKPFELSFNGLRNLDAFADLVDTVYDIWEDKFETGDFLNYAACFSEKEDSLNQWRCYSDNGRGCCVGFSKEQIEKYCKNSGGVVRLEKIKYISKDELQHVINEKAGEILSILSSEACGDILGKLNSAIEDVFIDSLMYKSDAFKEEDEWRIFLSKGAYLDRDDYADNQDKEASYTYEFLKNRIEIHPTEDDFVSYCSLSFSEFEKDPVEEIWLGPKNIAKRADMEFMLDKFGYSRCSIKFSDISYF